MVRRDLHNDIESFIRHGVIVSISASIATVSFEMNAPPTETGIRDIAFLRCNHVAGRLFFENRIRGVREGIPDLREVNHQRREPPKHKHEPKNQLNNACGARCE